MSEDAAVAAAAADLTQDAETITTALSALQGIVTALQAEVASNPDVVQLRHPGRAADRAGSRGRDHRHRDRRRDR